MSSITAIYNLTGSVAIEVSDLAPDYADLFAGIAHGSGRVALHDPRFGYVLQSGGEVVAERSWPPAGVRYRATDQQILESDRVSLVPAITYQLTAWVEYGGQRIEGEIEFLTPALPEPEEEELTPAQLQALMPETDDQ